jgi:hypothetical protein
MLSQRPVSLEGETGSTRLPLNQSICTPMPKAGRRGVERVRMKEAELTPFPLG